MQRVSISLAFPRIVEIGLDACCRYVKLDLGGPRLLEYIGSVRS